jgi:hypothetical protein
MERYGKVDWLRTGQFGYRTSVESNFPHRPDALGPTLASYIVGTGSFLGVKRLDCGDNHPPRLVPLCFHDRYLLHYNVFCRHVNMSPLFLVPWPGFGGRLDIKNAFCVPDLSSEHHSFPSGVHEWNWQQWRPALSSGWLANYQHPSKMASGTVL